MTTSIHAMPKLLPPFVREKNEHGHSVVTPEVEDGYEWVFEDPSVRAVEKLDGENASIYIENGVITGVWSREIRIPFFNHLHETVIEAISNAYRRNYTEFMSDGQHFGECIGPNIHKNMYRLDKVLWVPFSMLYDKYSYRSWGKYPKTFDAMSEWFKELPSPYGMSRGVRDIRAEGIVFTQPSTGKMAKLRRDHFSWYEGQRHGESYNTYAGVHNDTRL